jgi:hypothetical protein
MVKGIALDLARPAELWSTRPARGNGNGHALRHDPQLIDMIPLGRIGKPAEIAGLVS